MGEEVADERHLQFDGVVLVKPAGGFQLERILSGQRAGHLRVHRYGPEGRLPCALGHDIAGRAGMQVHAEYHDHVHIRRAFPGQAMDHVTGDAAGEDPAGMRNHPAHGRRGGNAVGAALREKIPDPGLAFPLTRRVPASGKDGFSDLHECASNHDRLDFVDISTMPIKRFCHGKRRRSRLFF
ncbi:hypothetical protein DESC_720079 [Desulfosarcina cetonica]|nr:hypothetical protein DESC_720079 [Desulfosarcina cetonica]